MLVFDGKEYRTIADIRAQFPISEKKIKKLVQEGALPAPETIKYGTREFQYYSDNWVKQLAKIVAPRARNGGRNG